MSFVGGSVVQGLTVSVRGGRGGRHVDEKSSRVESLWIRRPGGHFLLTLRQLGSGGGWC